jgi:hypothetical protein
MANLVRLTTTESNRLTNVGSYSFNTLKIKKVQPLGTGSLVFYNDGTNSSPSIIKIKVSESTTVVNEALTGPLDMQIPVNVLTIDGVANVLVQNIKTSDILLGIVDSNANYSVLKVLNGDLSRQEYRVNNTLADIETAANNYTIGQGAIVSTLTPLTNQTYAGQFNLSTNYEVEYNEYVTNSAETPTISASPLIDAIAGVIMKAGASASLVTTNMGVAWPGNDTFTANKSNFVAVMQKKPDTVSSTGLWYIIKVLN